MSHCRRRTPCCTTDMRGDATPPSTSSGRRVVPSPRRRDSAAGSSCTPATRSSGPQRTGGKVGGWLQSIVDAALEAEHLVLESGRRATVLRLGYLYGPDSRDLRAYRLAFRLGRPYWAGPRHNLQYFLHTDDAVARPAPRGHLAPCRPAAVRHRRHTGVFRRLHGLFRSRRRAPPSPPPAGHHAPIGARGGARTSPADGRSRRRRPRRAAPARFIARYPDYRAGLDQVLEAWQEKR